MLQPVQAVNTHQMNVLLFDTNAYCNTRFVFGIINWNQPYAWWNLLICVLQEVKRLGD